MSAANTSSAIRASRRGLDAHPRRHLTVEATQVLPGGSAVVEPDAGVGVVETDFSG